MAKVATDREHAALGHLIHEIRSLFSNYPHFLQAMAKVRKDNLDAAVLEATDAYVEGELKLRQTPIKECGGL